MDKPILLNREDLEKLLPDGDWIHVFYHPGDRDGMQWPRRKVFEMFDLYGAEVGPKAYRDANHGIVIIESPEQWYSIQNRMEKKNEVVP